MSQSQFGLLILVAPCWMEAFSLSRVLNMLENMPHEYSSVKHLIRDVSVGQVFKGLPSLHLTIWLLRDMCCTDSGYFPQSLREWQG